jgi:hypothetical protein
LFCAGSIVYSFLILARALCLAKVGMLPAWPTSVRRYDLPQLALGLVKKFPSSCEPESGPSTYFFEMCARLGFAIRPAAFVFRRGRTSTWLIRFSSPMSHSEFVGLVEALLSLIHPFIFFFTVMAHGILVRPTPALRCPHY